MPCELSFYAKMILENVPHLPIRLNVTDHSPIYGFFDNFNHLGYDCRMIGSINTNIHISVYTLDQVFVQTKK